MDKGPIGTKKVKKLAARDSIPVSFMVIERAVRRYGRFFDVVLANALFTEAPFYNFRLEHHHKDVIMVVKGEQQVFFQDA
jgi:CRISPR/Cas system endoribonuclease Cas6 (RAMP superfamily)